MSLAVLLTLATAVVPIADVPFNDDFGLVFFEASVNGSDPLVFLLDTGFDVSILDAGAAERLGLPTLDVRTEAQPVTTPEPVAGPAIAETPPLETPPVPAPNGAGPGP